MKDEESSLQAVGIGTVQGMERRPGWPRQNGRVLRLGGRGGWARRRGSVRLEGLGKEFRLFPKSSGKPLSVK